MKILVFPCRKITFFIFFLNIQKNSRILTTHLGYIDVAKFLMCSVRGTLELKIDPFWRCIQNFSSINKSQGFGYPFENIGIASRFLLKSEIFEIFFCRKKIFKHYFLVLAIKGQLMVSTLPERKNFLDTPGDQGSHPKRDISNIGKSDLSLE